MEKWQLEIIKNPNISNAEAARLAGVTYSKIKYHRAKLGVKVDPDAKAIDYWTDDELDALAQNTNMTNGELAELLNRSKSSVQQKRGRLNLLGPSNDWSQEEKEYLIDNYRILSARRISEHLGRTVAAIIDYAHNIGLSKKNTFWTKPEVRVLQENIEKAPTELTALLPNKTIEQISYKKSWLNYTNRQRISDKGDKEFEIDRDVSLSAFSVKARYLELLNTLEVGDSFEYPAADSGRVNYAARELAHKRFVTKRVDNNIRRLWRLD